MNIKHIISIAALTLASMSAAAGGSVRWLSTTHDFGAFDEDYGAVGCDFRFVNTGTTPVSIVMARASCGCTTPGFSRGAVAPGDTGVVSVKFDPAGRPGRFTKYVAVDFSDGIERTKLYVKGTVIGSEGSVNRQFPVECGALRLGRGAVMFGQVNKGQMRTATIQVYNRSSDTIHPSVNRLPNHITVRTEPAAIPPGEQAAMVFFLRSDRTPLYGLVSDTLYLSADPVFSSLFPLPSVAVIQEDFSKLSEKQLANAPHAFVEEQSVDFGDVEDGPAVMREFTVKNTGKSRLDIRRVYSADAGVSAVADVERIKPGKTAKVTVIVEPSKLTGALLNARVSLLTNDPDRPVQNIRVVGTRK